MPDEIPINESVFEQQTGGRFSQPLRQNQPPPIQPVQRHVPPITPPVQQQTGGRFSQPLRQNQPPPIQPVQRHVPPITPPVQQQTGGRFSQPLRQNQPPPIQPVQRHVPPITPPVQQQTGGRFSQPLRQNQPPPIQPVQRHVPPITPPVQQQTGGRFSQPLRQNQPPPIQPVQRHVPPITPPVQTPSLASLQTRSLARPSSFWRSMLGVALICIIVIVVVINSSHTNLISFATNNIQTQGTPAPSYVPSNATLALQDPLQDNSKGFQWLVNENHFGSCLFQNNAYHAVVYGDASVVFHACSIQNTTINFSNFVYQITMI